MWNDFLANWKTTAAGIIAATATIIVDYLNGTMDTKSFVLALALAILGYLSKDATKTGTLKAPRI